MLNNLTDIEAIIPNDGFIKTVCGAFNVYMTREKLLDVISKCSDVKIKSGILLMQYKNFIIKAKV